MNTDRPVLGFSKDYVRAQVSSLMNNYHFTLFIDLQDLDVTDPDAIILLSNRIFEAGCDDGIVTGSSDGEGVAFQIEFDREARSFEEAVSTAIQDLSRVHLTATLVE